MNVRFGKLTKTFGPVKWLKILVNIVMFEAETLDNRAKTKLNEIMLVFSPSLGSTGVQPTPF